MELLVVIVIIVMVSVVVLPTVVATLGERAVVNGATLFQCPGRGPGRRDPSNAPAGIRLLADPTLSTFTATGRVDPTKSLASNRWVPTTIPPVYTEGTVNTFPGAMPANMVGTVTQNFSYPAT